MREQREQSREGDSPKTLRGFLVLRVGGTSEGMRACLTPRSQAPGPRAPRLQASKTTPVPNCGTVSISILTKWTKD